MTAERVDRLHEWFDLQLLLVEVLTKECRVPFDRAVTHYTNFHRRFGFGRPTHGPYADEWLAFVAELRQVERRVDQVEITKIFGRERIISDNPVGRPEFGCFNFDSPDEQGVVRLHFSANDGTQGTGPLHFSKVDKRRRELSEMFAHIHRTHPDTAIDVAGASWLYNIDAYRRLLPEKFTATSVVYRSPHMTLPGMPFWGQFLDHNEQVKPEAREQFLRNLESIELGQLWKLFPMPVMLTRAPIAVFYEYYDVNPGENEQ